MSKPDFIIIGAMKCATSTLHEQLAQQPGFAMSTPKEPNFFSNDEQYAKGMAWYQSIFPDIQDAILLGESSTHYTKLPTYPHTIERIQAHLGSDVKFIYIIREPIERLVSHYIHEWSQGVIHCPIDDAIDKHPELISYSRYAMQLAPYIEAFGKEKILLLGFEKLKNQPQQELERVCQFLGYPGTPVWQEQVKQTNVSSQRIRKFPFYRQLVESTLATTLRRILVPQSIRNIVKGRLTMKERPTLSPAKIQQLTEIFNQDLAQLNHELKVTLDCQNFKAVTKEQMLEWK